jgi:hypothetical protein
MLIGREHNQWNFKWVVGISLAFSALFNIGHIFQYELNDGTAYVYTEGELYLYPLFPMTSSVASWLYMYLVASFLINYFVFFMINTIVEVTIVRKLHSELAIKKKRHDDMQMRSHTSTADIFHPVSFRRKRKQEIEEKTEQRAIIMVVVNACINLFFRLSELLVLVSISNQLFESSPIFNFFYNFYNFKELAADLASFFFIITFSTNFLVYYLFNLKFKQTFAEWRHFKKRN